MSEREEEEEDLFDECNRHCWSARARPVGRSSFSLLFPSNAWRVLSVGTSYSERHQAMCLCLPFRLHRASQAAKGQSKITDGCRLLTVFTFSETIHSCGIHDLKEIKKKWLMLISKCRSGDEHHHEDRKRLSNCPHFRFIFTSFDHNSIDDVSEESLMSRQLLLCCYESYF